MSPTGQLIFIACSIAISIITVQSHPSAPLPDTCGGWDCKSDAECVNQTCPICGPVQGCCPQCFPQDYYCGRSCPDSSFCAGSCGLCNQSGICIPGTAPPTPSPVPPGTCNASCSDNNDCITSDSCPFCPLDARTCSPTTYYCHQFCFDDGDCGADCSICNTTQNICVYGSTPPPTPTSCGAPCSGVGPVGDLECMLQGGQCKTCTSVDFFFLCK